MITETLSRSPDRDHGAWLAALNADEQIVVHTPPGYWHDLVDISHVKRLLLAPMPDEIRVRFLQYLESLPSNQVNQLLTIKAVRVVEPACDTAMAMIEEMRPLHIADKIRVMHDLKIFAEFIRLNPSLLKAMKIMARAPRGAEAHTTAKG